MQYDEVAEHGEMAFPSKSWNAERKGGLLGYEEAARGPALCLRKMQGQIL